VLQRVIILFRENRGGGLFEAAEPGQWAAGGRQASGEEEKRLLTFPQNPSMHGGEKR
jgi:hypothetical protein